jgi:hypothetical protein
LVQIFTIQIDKKFYRNHKKLSEANKIYAESDNGDKKRAFMRLLNYSKYLTDNNCCHPIQQDLQNVVVSSRQEGGPVTYPGISNYFGLGEKEEIQRQVSDSFTVIINASF